MYVLLQIILMLLDIYKYVMIAMIVMSWLVAFNAVNTRNQFVYQVWRILNALTEPVLRPIRRWLPDFSGLDLSPLFVFVIILFIQMAIGRYLLPYAF
jgi:YggT family protein